MSIRRTECAAALIAAASSMTLAGPDRGGSYLYRVLNADGTYTSIAPRSESTSVARQWNEVLLESIRNDQARPTVHARNLYHVSAAMYDAWAAYDTVADQVFHQERQTAPDIQAARNEAISMAAYRVLLHRFQFSVAAPDALPLMNALMDTLGYDKTDTSTVGDTPAALGNRIAQTIIAAGQADNANEQLDYANLYYTPVNEPIFPDLPGNPDISDANRWQPIAIDFYVDQSGNIIPLGSLTFLSPEWGNVTPFALRIDDLTVHQRDGHDWPVFHDPGDPPQLGGVGDDYFKWGNEMVAIWSGHLDPTDGVMIDISPNSFGNSPLPNPEEWAAYYDFINGGDWSPGHDLNPATGLPYPTQVVPRGDYGRILAEFWADGPDSETPPGHWFSIANYVTDHPLFEKRIAGEGPVVSDLEWDVKLYLMLGGAMHDCAITAWGCKGYYDYVRPISALRHMCDLGQCTDPLLPSYHANGVNLVPGWIELVDSTTTQPGGKHEHLAGNEGKIAIKAWRGPDYIANPDTDDAGVGWILAENWWPYQRPSFVTPPFAGYVSGHSTFSRGAAELMTLMTGSEFFPGGVGEFHCPQNEFLVFEEGPSQDITLQWATYRDASDQTSMSRIWGGIHPPADDIPGRHMGVQAGPDAYWLSRLYFDGRVSCPVDYDSNGAVNLDDLDLWVTAFLSADMYIADCDGNGILNFDDIDCFVAGFLAGCP
ncbi:MAG: vanadium-dependent haloperoxidase [Phycisphaerales bacterium]